MPPAGDVHALSIRIDGLKDNLVAAEGRITFWRSIGCTVTGALLGVLTGLAPLVWGSYGSSADVAANREALRIMVRDMASVQGSLEVLIRQTKPLDKQQN